MAKHRRDRYKIFKNTQWWIRNDHQHFGPFPTWRQAYIAAQHLTGQS